MILGHLNEIDVILKGQNIKQSLINKALELNKQVYAFDDISKFVPKQMAEQIYFPLVNDAYLPPNRFNKLFRLSKPIVSVFGTSSRQGKFTLQLEIRKRMLRQGYSIGQLGTEPTAELFGIDYCFPIGYGSTVSISGNDAIRYINWTMNELCLRDVDLIITGCQSGTVSYDFGNINNINLPQYTFLLATQPDAVILLVNSYDEVSYIKRTIAFIESSVDCEIIALVIFPMKIQENWTGIYGSKRKMDIKEQEDCRRVNRPEILYKIHIDTFLV